MPRVLTFPFELKRNVNQIHMKLFERKVTFWCVSPWAPPPPPGWDNGSPAVAESLIDSREIPFTPRSERTGTIIIEDIWLDAAIHGRPGITRKNPLKREPCSWWKGSWFLAAHLTACTDCLFLLCVSVPSLCMSQGVALSTPLFFFFEGLLTYWSIPNWFDFYIILSSYCLH